VILAAGHSPLRANGEVQEGEGIEELDLTWDSGDCAEDPLSRRATVIVTEVSSGKSARVLPGQQATLVVAGRPFMVMSRGSTAPGGRSCGFAYWTLVRSDVWVRRSF